MWQKIKNYYHLVQAIIANIINGFPSRKLIVIGVTGTDGKTTTTSLIYHILKYAGLKVAMITSVGAYIGDQVYDIGFHVTTPSPFGLQKYIKIAVDQGIKYLVLETTSHALDQNRVWGIKYRIGVLTNITHEHLDYHKNYEEYAKVKLRLMVHSSLFIVNMDDKSFLLFKRVLSQVIPRSTSSLIVHENDFVDDSINRTNSILPQNRKDRCGCSSGAPQLAPPVFITYSLNNKKADFNLNNYEFKTNLLGKFNQYNCLAATATVKQLNIADKIIKEALLTFKLPSGRQEIVYDKDFRVMIDFAHTSNAFAKILPEVKKITKGRLIHVFGSAGLRDVTKRPEMGRESVKYADIIILTAEDPRSEKIEDINKSIESGIMNQELRIKQKTLIKINDRKEAIKYAINIAKKGDTVLLTGKAHEKSMNLGKGEEPWDEFGVVSSILQYG